MDFGVMNSPNGGHQGSAGDQLWRVEHPARQEGEISEAPTPAASMTTDKISSAIKIGNILICGHVNGNIYTWRRIKAIEMGGFLLAIKWLSLSNEFWFQWFYFVLSENSVNPNILCTRAHSLTRAWSWRYRTCLRWYRTCLWWYRTCLWW